MPDRAVVRLKADGGEYGVRLLTEDREPAVGELGLLEEFPARAERIRLEVAEHRAAARDLALAVAPRSEREALRDKPTERFEADRK